MLPSDVSISIPAYDASKTSPLIYSLGSQASGSFKTLIIRYQFRVFLIRKSDTIFQIASPSGGAGDNSWLSVGIRKPSVLEAVLATEGRESTRYLISEKTETGKWHEIQLSLVGGEPARLLRIELDGKRLPDGTVTDIIPVINGLSVGSAISKSEAFFGEIRAFRLIKSDFVYGEILFVAGAILLTLSLLTITIFFVTCKTESVLPGDSGTALINRSSNRSDDPLLIVRALACLFVLCQHCLGAMGPEKYNALPPSVWWFFTPAWAGIWIFFCLSGYLMGKAFFSGRYKADSLGVRHFYLNRALRIMPLYFFTLAAVVLLSRKELLSVENLSQFIRIISFTYNGELPINLIGWLWTISTEIHFYLLAPFLFVVLSPFLKKRNPALLFMGILFGLGIVIRFFEWQVIQKDFWKWATYIFKPLVPNLDLFLGGFILNVFVAENKNNPGGIKTKTPSALIILLMITLYLTTARITYGNFLKAWPLSREINVYLLPTFTALLTLTIIYLIERNKVFNSFNGVLKKKSAFDKPTKLLELFGILTYGIFVLHPPVMDFVRSLIIKAQWVSSSPSLEYFVTSVAVLAGSSCVASISYLVLEKPVERFKKF